eukprot:Pgem_evm1s12343
MTPHYSGEETKPYVLTTESENEKKLWIKLLMETINIVLRVQYERVMPNCVDSTFKSSLIGGKKRKSLNRKRKSKTPSMSTPVLTQIVNGTPEHGSGSLSSATKQEFLEHSAQTLEALNASYQNSAAVKEDEKKDLSKVKGNQKKKRVSKRVAADVKSGRSSFVSTGTMSALPSMLPSTLPEDNNDSGTDIESNPARTVRAKRSSSSNKRISRVMDSTFFAGETDESGAESSKTDNESNEPCEISGPNLGFITAPINSDYLKEFDMSEEEEGDFVNNSTESLALSDDDVEGKVFVTSQPTSNFIDSDMMITDANILKHGSIKVFKNDEKGGQLFYVVVRTNGLIELHKDVESYKSKAKPAEKKNLCNMFNKVKLVVDGDYDETHDGYSLMFTDDNEFSKWYLTFDADMELTMWYTVLRPMLEKNKDIIVKQDDCDYFNSHESSEELSSSESDFDKSMENIQHATKFSVLAGDGDFTIDDLDRIEQLNLNEMGSFPSKVATMDFTEEMHYKDNGEDKYTLSTGQPSLYDQ